MQKHPIRIGFIALYIAISLFLAPQTHAQTLSQTERTTLEDQIAILLQQIDFLQSLIAERQAGPTAKEPLYETNFYGTDFEAIYKVTNGELVRIDKNTNPRSRHKDLWELFVDIVGEDNTNIYIDEFRVFDDEDSALGGFVEVKPRLSSDPEEWILAINEDNYVQGRSSAKDLYTDLLIHEYAHILLYRLDDFTADFADTFWTSADYRHSRKLQDVAINDTEEILEDYYDENKDRFVSDYATLNVDEDLAETFAVFVTEGRPISSQKDEMDEKIKMLYTVPMLVTARKEIRKNLRID